MTTPTEISLLHGWLPDYTDRLPIEFDYADVHYNGKFENVSVHRKIIDTDVRITHYEANLPDSILLSADYTEYTDYSVCEWVFSFTNYGGERSKILTNAHISFSLDAESPKFIYGNGDTCKPDGYSFFETNLDEPITLAPTDGTPCNGASPFMKLLTPDKSARIAVGWPGVWEANISKSNGKVSIKLGQKRLNTVILPGETIRTPSITLMAHTGDDNRGINMWRHWYFDHILPNDKGQPLSSQLCLHYWKAEGKPEFTAATEENQLRAIDSYLENGLKPDIWWIDAGWYPCDYDWTKIGSWYHDKERFPNGLEPIGSKCRDIDAKLLLWFEPERVREGSELDREHPEWLLKKHDGGDKLLDLGNPYALKWLCDRVNSLIKEYKVGIYRQDFNFNPLPIWCDNEAADRIGAIENGHVQGYLKYWDCLLFTNPGLIIDTCASGGR
nr:alpha-galactosidase [Clostridia bacterium]